MKWIAPAAVVVALAPGGPSLAGEASRGVREVHHAVDYLAAARPGLEFGMAIHVEGEGWVYERHADRPRPAASAIKTFVALDLIRERRGRLHEPVSGVDSLLAAGAHPAFQGFSGEQLAAARHALPGLSYLRIARIMMDRTGHQNDVYNAACNVLMVDLGGPGAIGARVRALDPGFGGLDLNRYMLSWNHDGDNLVTPRVLAALYRALSRGEVADLDDEEASLLRSLLRSHGDGGPGTRYEKLGTLYPDPMVRVQAGYVERGDRDLVYAVMGQIRPGLGIEAEGAFVGLLAAVDTLAAMCTEIP